MKEKEFEEELKKMGFQDGLEMEVYYGIDDDGNVLLDETSMREEFEMKLMVLRIILE